MNGVRFHRIVKSIAFCIVFYGILTPQSGSAPFCIVFTIFSHPPRVGLQEVLEISACAFWYGILEYPDIFGTALCLSTHWPGMFTNENKCLPIAPCNSSCGRYWSSWSAAIGATQCRTHKQPCFTSLYYE